MCRCGAGAGSIVVMLRIACIATGFVDCRLSLGASEVGAFRLHQCSRSGHVGVPRPADVLDRSRFSAHEMCASSRCCGDCRSRDDSASGRPDEGCVPVATVTAVAGVGLVRHMDRTPLRGSRPSCGVRNSAMSMFARSTVGQRLFLIDRAGRGITAHWFRLKSARASAT